MKENPGKGESITDETAEHYLMDLRYIFRRAKLGNIRKEMKDKVKTDVIPKLDSWMRRKKDGTEVAYSAAQRSRWRVLVKHYLSWCDGVKDRKRSAEAAADERAPQAGLAGWGMRAFGTNESSTSSH